MIGNLVNGKDEGEFKLYYENGKLSEVGNFINSNREGEWKFYDEKGILLWTKKYKNGELIK